ncbi:MAG TPA: Crp/Fnr family transcriptional regulator [Thermoanaerobaculia bacterium]|jgi:CRP-like cAMP-binding protein|nr:Crp/Fnr family transcriptional regulator [Thermoanaerobaculia bacterium]
MTTALQLETNRGNLLLSQLAVHERNAVHRGAETVPLEAGELLVHSGRRSDFVFFPTNSVASVVRTLRGGMSIELALIGNEGMVGLDVFTDAKASLDDVVVQSPGWAYRLPADDLRRQFNRSGGLQKYLLLFADALLNQIAQTAVCSRYHAPEARLARWLLMIRDRTSVDEILATPAAMRAMLAIAPERVAECVARLVAARAIVLRQETITIVDREGLEVRACECYETLSDMPLE